MNTTNTPAENETSKFEESNNPNTFALVNGILNAPLMLSAIMGNALVFGTILTTPSLRSPSTILLCSLALSDLLVGLVVQPLYIAGQFKIYNGSRLEEIMQFYHVWCFVLYSNCGECR